jgi:hypothetical protein
MKINRKVEEVLVGIATLVMIVVLVFVLFPVSWVIVIAAAGFKFGEIAYAVGRAYIRGKYDY